MPLGQLTVTPRQAQATAGDDWVMGFTLWESGKPKDLTGASISVDVRTLGQMPIISAVSQSSASTGADWASGRVTVVIPSASTGSLFRNDYFLEIEVQLAGLTTTWPLIPVSCERQTITH